MSVLQLKEHLTCGVCLDLFLNPCTLPCGHTFCKACLLLWFASNAIKCPVCRHEYLTLQTRVNVCLQEVCNVYRREEIRRDITTAVDISVDLLEQMPIPD